MNNLTELIADEVDRWEHFLDTLEDGDGVFDVHVLARTK